MKFTYRTAKYLKTPLYDNAKNRWSGEYVFVVIWDSDIPPPTRLEKIIRWFREKLGFSGAF